MIEKICENLTNRIRKEMPEIDDEKAEAINYGLELIIGETPKLILLFVVAIAFNIAPLVIFAYVTMLPYKFMAGGFHLKTNIGCTVGTFIIYYGNVFLSKNIVIENIYIKIILCIAILTLAVVMITRYAPADTVNLPILRKKERKIKRNLSYVFATITIIIGLIIPNNTLSNILIINVLIETLCITELAYKITRNEYGYKTYLKQESVG